MPALDPQLGSALDSLLQAVNSGNTQSVQEAIRQWNLTYTNQVANEYGQNFGVGQPAPPGAPNLAAQQAQGGIGYIPGQSGFNADQSLAAQNQYYNQAIAGAGLTGYFAAPGQSQYSPGTWVQTQDPSGVNGTQYAIVTPSGQIQRMGLTEATARGFQNNATPIGYQQFMALAAAPPTGTPQQTLAGLAGYQALNTNANTNALNTAATTGYYQTPQPTLAPGIANDGSSFFQQDQATQQAYMDRFHDPNAALQGWTNATNDAINQSRAAQGLPPLTTYGYAGAQGAQPTMAREQQTYAQQMGMIKQAADLQANPFRQQQAIGQMGNLLAGRGVAGFSAPNTVPGVGTQGGNMQGGMGYLQQMIGDITGQPVYPQQPGMQNAAMTMQQQPGSNAAYGQLGTPGVQFGGQRLGGQYGQYGQYGQSQGQGQGSIMQTIQDIRDPTPNQMSMNQVLNAIPTPNKISSTDFLRSAPSTQNMVLQGMQERYGIDPKDALAQINATLPQFTAPATAGVVRRG